MKALTATTILFILVNTLLSAQNAPGKPVESPQARAKKMVAKLSTAVGIKGEQVGQVNQLFTDFYTRKDVIKADSKSDKQQRETQLKKLKREKQQKLKSILTPEQWKLWQELQHKDKANKK